MKKIFTAIALLFMFSIASAQEVNDSTFAEISQAEEFEIDARVSFWQLTENIIYEDLKLYPDSIQSIIEFEQGNDFLSLNENGEYIKIESGNFSKG